MHEGKPILNIQIGGQWCIDGSSIYICRMCLVSPVVISTNKTNFSFREIARLIPRNSLWFHLPEILYSSLHLKLFDIAQR